MACAECNQAARLVVWERLGRCPNPACRVGMYFEQIVQGAYRRACAEIDRRVEADLRARGTAGNYRTTATIARSLYPPAPVFEGVQPTLWAYFGPYPIDA